VSINGAGARIGVKTVSGDVQINRTAGEAQVETVSGDVSLDKVTGSCEVRTRSGDVQLAASGPVSGSIATVSGDIHIALARNADLVLELATEGGDIEVDPDLPHEVLEEREGFMKVKFGAGSRTLKVNTHSADIDVSAVEEQ